MELTKKESEFLYNVATKRFLIGDYKTAYACYYVLSTHNPLDSLYIKSLAGCAQKQKEYEQAFYYYRFAYELNNNEIECIFYAAICLFYLRDYEFSLIHFQDFLQVETNQESKLIKRTNEYIAIINKISLKAIGI